MATVDNVTLRGGEGVNRPLSYEELDNNFKELINIINDYNSFYNNEFTQPTTILTGVSGIVDLNISESKQYVIEMTGETTITFSGQRQDVLSEVWLEAKPPSLLTFDNVLLDQSYFLEPGTNYILYHLVWIDNSWKAKVHITG